MRPSGQSLLSQHRSSSRHVSPQRFGVPSGQMHTPPSQTGSPAQSSSVQQSPVGMHAVLHALVSRGQRQAWSASQTRGSGQSSLVQHAVAGMQSPSQGCSSAAHVVGGSWERCDRSRLRRRRLRLRFFASRAGDLTGEVMPPRTEPISVPAATRRVSDVDRILVSASKRVPSIAYPSHVLLQAPSRGFSP